MKTSKPVLIFVATATLNGFCADTNSSGASTQAAATRVISYAPAVLPGKGLAQHPFLYGDTVICNWCPHGLKDPKLWSGAVQVLEVTLEKKMVWALREWKNPDLGPASSIQLLDEPGTEENPGDMQR